MIREPVLNSACVGLGIDGLDQAVAATTDLERGLIALFSANHVYQQLRLHAPVHEIEVSAGVTLYTVFQEICRRAPDRGRFLMRMVTKFPIEQDVSDEELEALIDWRLPTYPDCLSVVLCAISNSKLLVSLTTDGGWTVSPLRLMLTKNIDEGECTKEIEIANLYSFGNAGELIVLFDQDVLRDIDPIGVWNRKDELFPRLQFGPRVESDLQGVGPDVYRAAVGRLSELNRAAIEWASGGAPRPRYLSKVTGESSATMQRYGHERIFRSAAGTRETYEKHARLPNGHRLHLRELVESKRIEIGYVGPHLSIVSGG